MTGFQRTDEAARKDAFAALSVMETPLGDARDLARALLYVANQLNNEDGDAVAVIARNIIREVEAVEVQRSVAWQASHGNRTHFDRTGWPGDQPQVVA